MQAAASMLGKNPVSTSCTANKCPNLDDDTDEEELSILYMNSPPAVHAPPVFVAPLTDTVPTMANTNNAAITTGLLPTVPTGGAAGLSLLPPVAAIVGNGRQANNQALSLTIGLAAGGGI